MYIALLVKYLVFRNTKYFKRRFIKVGKSALVSYLIVATVFFGTGITFLLKPWWDGSSEVGAAWFNDNWSYRQLITVTNNGSAQTNYQVQVAIDTATLISAGKLQASCADLIELVRKISLSPINRRIIEQLVGFGASLGANYCEANEAESKKDFSIK